MVNKGSKKVIPVEASAFTGKAAGQAGPPARLARKRLNIEFPQRVADQLDSYAEVTGRSKTEFLRLAIGTYAVLCDEMLSGNRVFVASSDGSKLLRELVLPA